MKPWQWMLTAAAAVFVWEAVVYFIDIVAYMNSVAATVLPGGL